MVPKLTFVLLGNPENRRVHFFQNALARFNQPSATVISWLDLLRNRVQLKTILQPRHVLRIDSPGENFEVDKLFLEIGENETDEVGNPPRISRKKIRRLTSEKGRIFYPRQWYLGFRKILWEIQAVLQTIPDIRVTHPPSDIEIMFDKRLCYQHCSTYAIPVPPHLGNVCSFDELMVKMASSHIKRVFIKLANGSSASGVVALETNGKYLQAFTSVEIVRTQQNLKLYNSLKIRRYKNLRDISDIVNTICREGTHVEKWMPKAGWQGHCCDMRVITIAGKAQHAVLRLSKSPMTNLHLGNRRGNLTEFLVYFGDDRWTKAKMICQRAASVFPQSLHTGVDLLFSSGFKHCAVAEINAFGDLLPNVMYNGLDTYEAQVKEYLKSKSQKSNVESQKSNVSAFDF
jgi:hypothetical protein